MIKEFTKGLFKENPIFVIALGLCPTLATSTMVINALGMGAGVIFVLVCSNIFISLLKNFIPDNVRIPAYIVVIASFVTIVQMVMEAYAPALYAALRTSDRSKLYHPWSCRGICQQEQGSPFHPGRSWNGCGLHTGPYTHRSDQRGAGIRYNHTSRLCNHSSCHLNCSYESYRIPGRSSSCTWSAQGILPVQRRQEIRG